MITYFRIPDYPLNNYIESIFYFKDFNPIGNIDRFFPDGNVNLIFELTEQVNPIYDNSTLLEKQSCTKIWFSGIRKNFISIPSGRDSEKIVITFCKGKSYPFVQAPLNEYTDNVVDAELVFSYDILELRERIIEEQNVSSKIDFIENYFLEKYKGKLNNNVFIDYAISYLNNGFDSVSMKKLTDKIGYSQKHFTKIFKDNVGITPKEYSNLIRFQYLINHLNYNNSTDWNDLVSLCGYYDQSHLINSFKHYTGMTPMEYLSKDIKFQNYVTVQ